MVLLRNTFDRAGIDFAIFGNVQERNDGAQVNGIGGGYQGAHLGLVAGEHDQRHDREGRYRFAAMQSPSGRTLLAQHGLDPDDPTSFLLIEGDAAHRDTDAIRLLVRYGADIEEPLNLDAPIEETLEALDGRDVMVVFLESYGYANREWQVPNAPDTKFRIGSVAISS